MSDFIYGAFVGWVVGSLGTAFTLCLFMGARAAGLNREPEE